MRVHKRPLCRCSKFLETLGVRGHLPLHLPKIVLELLQVLRVSFHRLLACVDLSCLIKLHFDRSKSDLGWITGFGRSTAGSGETTAMNSIEGRKRLVGKLAGQTGHPAMQPAGLLRALL